MIGDMKLRSWSVFQRTEVYAAGAMQLTEKKGGKKHSIHTLLLPFTATLMVQFSYLLLLIQLQDLYLNTHHVSPVVPLIPQQPSEGSFIFLRKKSTIYVICLLTQCGKLKERNCLSKYFYRCREQFTAPACALRCFTEWINPLNARWLNRFC